MSFPPRLLRPGTSTLCMLGASMGLGSRNWGLGPEARGWSSLLDMPTRDVLLLEAATGAHRLGIESAEMQPCLLPLRLPTRPPIIATVPLEQSPAFDVFPSCCRECVRREVFCGEEAEGAHRSGTEGAVAAVLGAAAAAYAVYSTSPGLASGGLLGMEAAALACMLGP